MYKVSRSVSVCNERHKIPILPKKRYRSLIYIKVKNPFYVWKFTTNFIKKQTSRKQSSSYFMAEAKCKQSVDTCKVVATQRVKNAKEIKLEFYGNVRHETLSNQNLDKLKEKERKI